MATKQPTVSPQEARDDAKKDAPRADNPKPDFKAPLMPFEGGSYTRGSDGTLKRTQKPTEVPFSAPADADARKRAADEAKE